MALKFPISTPAEAAHPFYRSIANAKEGGVFSVILTVELLSEVVKEMGGAPIHGSFVVVEGDDGSLFGVMIAGDSGVGLEGATPLLGARTAPSASLSSLRAVPTGAVRNSPGEPRPVHRVERSPPSTSPPGFPPPWFAPSGTP